MGVVRSYIFLTEIRHDGSVFTNFEIDPKTEHLLLPTLSLQMLIENAVKHNSFNEKNPLHILIKSKGKNQILVRNNLNIRKTNKISAGIGLQNIKQRYGLYSSKLVEIDQNESVFEVRLPLLNPAEI
jgi:two-component system LytT family sensor kinase